jgi:hypothetical protein
VNGQPGALRRRLPQVNLGQQSEAVQLAPPVEAAHQVDGGPLVVRVAAVQLVDRPREHERVVARREDSLDPAEIPLVRVERESVGNAQIVEVLARRERRLAEPALDRAQPCSASITSALTSPSLRYSSRSLKNLTQATRADSLPPARLRSIAALIVSWSSPSRRNSRKLRRSLSGSSSATPLRRDLPPRWPSSRMSTLPE